MRKGVNDILLAIVSLLAIGLFGYLLYNADWNPHTDSYTQYLPGIPGAYTALASVDDHYAGLVDVSESNRFIVVFMDVYGEVKKAYEFTAPAAVLGTYFDQFYVAYPVGGSIRLVLFSSDGKPGDVVDYNFPVGYKFPRFISVGSVDGIRLPFYAEYGGNKYVVFISVDRNILAPVGKRIPLPSSAQGYVLKSFDGTPYLLYFENAYSPVFLSTSGSGWAIRYDGDIPLSLLSVYRTKGSMYFAFPEDKGIVVARSEGGQVVWSKKIFVKANGAPLSVVTRGDTVFFGGTNVFGFVEINTDDGNVLASSITVNAFLTLAYHDAIAHYLIYGSEGGAPAYITNMVGEFKCPESMAPAEANVSTVRFTLKPENLEVKNLAMFISKESFDLAQVFPDEDFSCYSP